jgi:hypothetical protein
MAVFAGKEVHSRVMFAVSDWLEDIKNRGGKISDDKAAAAKGYTFGSHLVEHLNQKFPAWTSDTNLVVHVLIALLNSSIDENTCIPLGVEKFLAMTETTEIKPQDFDELIVAVEGVTLTSEELAAVIAVASETYKNTTEFFEKLYEAAPNTLTAATEGLLGLTKDNINDSKTSKGWYAIITVLLERAPPLDDGDAVDDEVGDEVDDAVDHMAVYENLFGNHLGKAEKIDVYDSELFDLLQQYEKIALRYYSRTPSIFKRVTLTKTEVKSS